MVAYYNENDPFAAAWLRELIAAGHIAPGIVDDRSIVDVKPEDLNGFEQCHFFAGIGGWSRALRLAGWSDYRHVWTGSPPCQPFSLAGKQAGNDDTRHLAPTWLALVKACRPVAVFGEQVAAAVTKDNWLDDLQNALETEDYATGAVVLPACGVGSPHLRQRLWFTAQRLDDGQRKGLERFCRDGDRNHQPGRQQAQPPRPTTKAGTASGLANTNSATGRKNTGGASSAQNQPSSVRRREPDNGNGHTGNGEIHTSGALNGFWRDADWLGCRDGRWRAVEPGTFPLVNGIPNRVGRVRGYGNAIVPQVAAEVIKAIIELQDSSGLLAAFNRIGDTSCE